MSFLIISLSGNHYTTYNNDATVTLCMLSRICLGSFLSLLSGIGLILNALSLISVFRLAFVIRKNQVYVIAFFNILTDIVQLSLTAFYQGPAIIENSFLFSDQKKDVYTLILGSIFMFCWYFETIAQMVMALNRYVVICHYNHNFFTFTSTLAMFSVIFPVCFVAMYTSQYSNPCCSFLFDQEILGWSYYEIPGVHNYSNDLDLPLNATSSIISSILYVLIFFFIHRNSSHRSQADCKARRRREIRYALQFCAILMFYIFVWVLFRLLPLVLSSQETEWFILIPLFFTLNCSSNAFIYLFFNSELDTPHEPTVTPMHSVPNITHVAPIFITRQRHQPFKMIRATASIH